MILIYFCLNMFHHNTLDGNILASMLRTAQLPWPLTSPWLLDEEKTMNLCRWKLPCLVAEPRSRNNKSYWNVCLESPVLLVGNIPTQMEMLCSLNPNHSHPFLRLYSYSKRNTDHAGSLEIIVHQKHEANLCNKGQGKFIIGSRGVC